ncbi:hypothetical protein DPMN_080645 [Dreissena polymorpha]|uniref:Uncharacterized protein n=1 Tax=Dreissena polymorpha TaxID=45954 RepID=A0A9D3YWT5_DREPO|nr:hypothetical protein DPMN_080645 [Dreissena polymorpha]
MMQFRWCCQQCKKSSVTLERSPMKSLKGATVRLAASVVVKAFVMQFRWPC